MTKRADPVDAVERERVRRRAYMQRYNSTDEAGTLPAKEVGAGRGEPPFAAKTENALYVPGRDAPLRHADLTAQIMGDPPIGRRAIDRKPR